MPPRLVLAACALRCWPGQNRALALDLQRLQQKLQTRFNEAGAAIFKDWPQLLGARQSLAATQLLHENVTGPAVSRN